MVSLASSVSTAGRRRAFCFPYYVIDDSACLGDMHFPRYGRLACSAIEYERSFRGDEPHYGCDAARFICMSGPELLYEDPESHLSWIQLSFQQGRYVPDTHLQVFHAAGQSQRSRATRLARSGG